MTLTKTERAALALLAESVSGSLEGGNKHLRRPTIATLTKKGLVWTTGELHEWSAAAMRNGRGPNGSSRYVVIIVHLTEAGRAAAKSS